MDLDRLKAECSGKWLGIYSSLGIDVGNGKHKECPHCGGTDRFRYDDKFGHGNYFCNGCDAGDGFSLVGKVLGLEFKDVIKKIGGIVGMVDEDRVIEKPMVDPKIALTKVWKSSTPLTGSDPVSLYLHSRKLNLTPLNVLYCPNCYESDTKTEMPAMVARIFNKSGKPVSIHRTYLNGTGKADIKSPKKMMPGTEHLGGGAVRLFEPGGMFEKDSIGVAEGIETAISAAQMFMVATWACLSTTLLETFEPPDGIRKIVIFSDNDANYAGQKAAYTLAQRLYNRDLVVDVVMPNLSDFNDELMEGMLREIN